MSERWESFPCTIGDDTAVVTVDVGVSDDLPLEGLPVLLRLRVEFAAARPDGLPGEDEQGALDALEGDLEAMAAARGLAYVGRVTHGGHRTFYLYVGDPDADAEAADAVISDAHGYDWALAVDEDEDAELYWRELYPTPVDWQMIGNQEVLATLTAQGDDLTAPRRIDHWAWFEHAATRDEYAHFLKGGGYLIDELLEPTEERPTWGVRFHHVAAPTHVGIYELTLPLVTRALKLGGDYDGWETTVVAEEG